MGHTINGDEIKIANAILNNTYNTHARPQNNEYSEHFYWCVARVSLCKKKEAMKTWKKYLKQILPEAVCFCMGMIVLVQYCSQPPRFSETQEITDQSTLTSFKTAIRSHLSEVEETIDTLISLLTENHFTHAMHDYINERLSKENVNKEVDIQKCDSDRIFLERQK